MAFIRFLGTAGARFTMLSQTRASGGIWISDGRDQIILDPGPGALVRALTSQPTLDPSQLSAVILSHKHLDHSSDVNVMIEAMTGGGHQKRGAVFAPADAYGPDAVILAYLRHFPERVEVLKEKSLFRVGKIIFNARRLLHPVETYGFNFNLDGKVVSFVADTGYFPGIENLFNGEIMVINAVLLQPKPEIFHLSLPEAEKIIAQVAPKKAVLTHFGRTVLTQNPKRLTEAMSQRLGIEVIAAYDGWQIEI